MSRKRFICDKDISFVLNDEADNEDGLDFDDDSLADPDFFLNWILSKMMLQR